MRRILDWLRGPRQDDAGIAPIGRAGGGGGAPGSPPPGAPGYVGPDDDDADPGICAPGDPGCRMGLGGSAELRGVAWSPGGSGIGAARTDAGFPRESGFDPPAGVAIQGRNVGVNGLPLQPGNRGGIDRPAYTRPPVQGVLGVDVGINGLPRGVSGPDVFSPLDPDEMPGGFPGGPAEGGGVSPGPWIQSTLPRYGTLAGVGGGAGREVGGGGIARPAGRAEPGPVALQGFGVPHRFIALWHYLAWIRRITTALNEKFDLLSAVDRNLQRRDPDETHPGIQILRGVLVDWQSATLHAIEVVEGKRESYDGEVIPGRGIQRIIDRTLFTKFIDELIIALERVSNFQMAHWMDALGLAQVLRRPFDLAGEDSLFDQLTADSLQKTLEAEETPDQAIRQLEALKDLKKVLR